MSDIFISYSRHDQEWVGTLAKALEDVGYSIWWDTRLLAGDDFHEVIPAALEEASCVIVVWSKVSVTRKWVKAEAARANDRNVLIPIQLEPVAIPMPFNLLQAGNLQDWNGKTSHPALQRLVKSINRFCAKPLEPLNDLTVNPLSKQPSQLKQIARVGLFLPAFIAVLIASVGIYIDLQSLITAKTEQPAPTEQPIPVSSTNITTNEALFTTTDQLNPAKAAQTTATAPVPIKPAPKSPPPAERLQQAEAEFVSEKAADWKNAVAQLQDLANEGNVGAWRLLGFAYYKGRGLATDKRLGCSWYQKAAQAGNTSAKETYAKLCS